MSPDLRPLPSPAFGALSASFAPAVFLGAADFDDPAEDLEDDADEAFVEDPDAFVPFVFAEPADLVDEDLDAAADRFLAGSVIDSITDTAAPETAAEAAPTRASPTTSLVLS